MENDPDESCEHILNWKSVMKPASHECAECVRTGGHWVHLRTCQTCGVTLCCDSSPNKHASAHAMKSDHPVIISAEKGERWAWCYVDEIFVEY